MNSCILIEREAGDAPMIYRMEPWADFTLASFAARARMIETSTHRLGLPEWWLNDAKKAMNWVWYGGVEFQILPCIILDQDAERMN